MKDMTLTQEYFICAVNGKGKISGFSTEKQVCLVAAGLLELQMEGCICFAASLCAHLYKTANAIHIEAGE